MNDQPIWFFGTIKFLAAVVVTFKSIAKLFRGLSSAIPALYIQMKLDYTLNMPKKFCKAKILLSGHTSRRLMIQDQEQAARWCWGRVLIKTKLCWIIKSL